MVTGIRPVLFWIFVGVAIIWGVIGLALIPQINNLKTDLAGIKREIAASNGEVAELRKIVRQLGNSQANSTSGVSVDKTGSISGAPAIGASDIQLIRQFIKVVPSPSTAQPKFKIGDVFPQSISLPIPKELSDKLPKLRGTRFAIDQNGDIIISAVGENRVAIVIGMASAATAN